MSGEIDPDGRPVGKNLSLMVEIAVLCNEAVYNKAEAKVIGDSTEAAMLVFGVIMGQDKNEMAAIYSRAQEIPLIPEGI